MSAHAEAIVPELDLSLELNKETIQDLDIDAATAGQIKGGAGVVVAPVQGLSPGTSLNPSGGIVLNPSGGRV